MTEPHTPFAKRPTAVEEALRVKYERYIGAALRILQNGPMQALTLGQRLNLPKTIKPLQWAKLYPETFEVARNLVKIKGWQPPEKPKRDLQILPAALAPPAVADPTIAPPAVVKPKPKRDAEYFKALQNTYGKNPAK
jgi:hypothetical protein